MKHFSFHAFVLLATIFLIAGGCGKGTHSYEGDAELRILVHAGEVPTLAPRHADGAAVPEAVVDLSKTMLVIQNMRFQGSTELDVDGHHSGCCRHDGAHERDQDQSWHRDGHMNNTLDGVRLEEAGPFVIDLLGQTTALGPFILRQGHYTSVEIVIAPLNASMSDSELDASVTGYAIVLEGEYTATATDATAEPLRARLTDAAVRQYVASPPIDIRRHMLAAFHADPQGWFDGLDLSAARVSDATGTRIDIDSQRTPDLAQEIFRRVVGSLEFGVDENGDGEVTVDELLLDLIH